MLGINGLAFDEEPVLVTQHQFLAVQREEDIRHFVRVLLVVVAYLRFPSNVSEASSVEPGDLLIRTQPVFDDFDEHLRYRVLFL